ncbi:MAG: hypothetical protein NXI10_13380 [bacterium]|nr:hypothetical protein [bacterium]
MNPELTKLIEQYLAGELSEADVQVFEERLATNDTLRSAVEKQREIHSGAKRAHQRQQIQRIGKRYHLRKNLLRGGLSVLIIGVIAAASLFAYNQLTAEDEIPVLTDEVKAKLDQQAPMDLDAQYFLIPEEGGVVLSEDGVLISVPKGAFTMNGKPYKKPVAVQFQEAIDPGDIMQGGLSTTSNGELLETGGMVSVTGYTVDGKPLDFNPKVGVYVQVPIQDVKTDMQLFDGELMADGSINWVKPEPLKKIPVPVPMSDLDFYPAGYENYLDEQKWKTSKQSRDSLYLSFEEDGCYEGYDGVSLEDLEDFFESSPAVSEAVSTPVFQFADNKANLATPTYTVQLDDSTALIDSVAQDTEIPNYIYPSNILAFWNKGFNNTNLATREFERRMQMIHKTCDNAVLKVYTSNLDLTLKECDERVAAMGHPYFSLFAAENAGKVNARNPHVKHLQRFYEKSIKQMKRRNNVLQKQETKRRTKHDSETRKSREDEAKRTKWREQQAYKEEYNYNLKSMYKQLGYTRGFTITQSSLPKVERYVARSAIKNIDRLVADATRNRESLTVTRNGKTGKIVYNEFTFEVENAKEYIKLFAYVLPYELNSYQRIEGKNGKFSHPLNDAFRYNIAVVGVKENGYGLFKKLNIKKGNLGKVKLQHVSKKKLDADVKQLNSERNAGPMRIDSELEWLAQERKDYKEQKMRKEMTAFRDEIRNIIFPCCGTEQESAQQQQQQ